MAHPRAGAMAQHQQPADVAAFVSAWFAALTNGC
jgi:hypothetical protein